MAKRPAIANEDEYRGWENLLWFLEDKMRHFEEGISKGSFWNLSYAKAQLSATTKARDALLGPIRAYQEGRLNDGSKG